VEILPTRIRKGSSTFTANEAHQRALSAELRSRLERVKAGGGPEAVARHRGRGKMFDDLDLAFEIYNDL